jgi:hypothetical protein
MREQLVAQLGVIDRFVNSSKTKMGGTQHLLTKLLELDGLRDAYLGNGKVNGEAAL